MSKLNATRLADRLIRRYQNTRDSGALEQLRHILWYSFGLTYLEDWSESVKKYKREREKIRAAKKRIYRRVRDLFDRFDSVGFATLTFRDDVLATTNERTRHRYVVAFLNAHTKDYVANVDFGKQTEREHYHAVVAPFCALNEWEYGFVCVKPCKRSGSDQKRLSTYIAKLTNHAGKESAGRWFSKKSNKGFRDCDILPF